MCYVLYAQGHRAPDVYPRQHIVKFDELTQARAWLDRMERNLPEGFTVTSPQMDQIRAAPLTDWQIPDPYAGWIPRFKYGTWDEVREVTPRHEPEVTAAPRSKRRTKAQRPDGYVSITQLCANSGIAASDARTILRAHMEKPEYGWAFAPKDIPSIKKLCGIK